ncbi:MAG: HD-GYP domain-containing protein [Phycisphaerales bacterium]|nr:HD-GYP domain-containing protein [Phycisphaerales bacterium]
MTNEIIQDVARVIRWLVWRWPRGGTLAPMPSPDTDAAVATWQWAPAVLDRLQQALGDAPDDGVRVVVHGACAAFVGVGEARVVVLALTSEAATSGEFAEWCRAGEADPDVILRLLQSEGDVSDIERGVAALRLIDDRVCTDQRAIVDLSTQLSNMFEHVHFHYRVGQMMNCLNSPVEFVSGICDLMLGLTPFDWVAATVRDLTEWGDASADLDFVVAGRPAPSHGALRAACVRATTALAPAGDGVLQPGRDALATKAGSPVAARVLADDGRVIGAFFAGGKPGADADICSIELQLLGTGVDYLRVFHQNVRRYHQQIALFRGTMLALTRTIDAKDPYTGGHSERVGYVASELARLAGCSADEAERVNLAGLVHDIGKIGVPEAVLCKPGRLTEAEFAIIKTHPTVGYDILKDIKALQDVLPGVLHHHERWDGRGYPAGLVGEEIPLLARYLAVADAFDAMSSDRSYRSRLSRDQVLAEVRNGMGTQFCPDLARLFLEMDLSGYDALVEKHRTTDDRQAA